MSTATAIRHLTADTAEQVTAPVFSSDGRAGDGYDWMDTVEGTGWSVLPNWGGEGWDAGSWHYIPGQEPAGARKRHFTTIDNIIEIPSDSATSAPGQSKALECDGGPHLLAESPALYAAPEPGARGDGPERRAVLRLDVLGSR